MEDRQFEILRGQCLSIVARAFVAKGSDFNDASIRRALFKGARSLLAEAMVSGYLDVSKKEFLEPEPSGEVRKVCAECNKSISSNVVEFSERNFRRPLCVPCQKGAGK